MALPSFLHFLPLGGHRGASILSFTHTYFLVLVEWVDNQLHHAVHFGLEDMLFRLFSEFLDLCRVQSVQLDGLLLSDGSQTQQGPDETSCRDEGKKQAFLVSPHNRSQTFPVPRLGMRWKHLCAQAWSCWPCGANLRSSQPALAGMTRVHSWGRHLTCKVPPTSAPPRHLSWIHLCFSRGPPRRCHPHPPHPLLEQRLKNTKLTFKY